MTATAAPGSPPVEHTEQWLVTGEESLVAQVGAPGVDLARPSLLPGWSRRHVVAHLFGNARALGNLVRWATTGVETPMYASPAARAEQIEQDAQRPDDWLVEALGRSSGHLRRDLVAMEPAARARQVRTAQGRTVPGEAVLWMRIRESALHLIDLDLGPTAADLPVPLVHALLDDITGTLATRPNVPAVRLIATDSARRWTVAGGPVVEQRSVEREVAAPAAALLLWAAGRPPAAGTDRTDWPALPAWL